MDKRWRKVEGKSKLRKEDIGTPVNFIHVQHVGYGQKPNYSVSACTSPTYTTEPFFNNRLSDSSMAGQNLDISYGKENQFSNGVVTRPKNRPPIPPYGSMSNLSITNKRESSTEKNLLSNRQSFSGSLLNLNLFRRAEKTSTRNEPLKPKRMSLGILNPMSFSPHSTNTNNSLADHCIPEVSERSYTRRRSSSFSSDGEFHSTFENKPHTKDANRNSALGQVFGIPRSNSVSAWIKKPKIQTSPPMSPSYDELPPPPEDVFNVLPVPMTPLCEDEFHTNDDVLPPPPPTPERRRKHSSELCDVQLPLPLPPSPPVAIRKMPIESETDSFTKKFNKLPNGPPVPPTRAGGVTTNKVTNWRQKVIRVNAPTLPPLSVPLIITSQSSPDTPSSWPLEPTLPIPNSNEYLHENPQIISENVELPPPDPQEDSQTFTENIEFPPPLPEEDLHTISENLDFPTPDPPQDDLHAFLENLDFPPPDLQEDPTLAKTSCSNFRQPVDPMHLEPLSYLLKTKIPCMKWPKVMNQLFSKINFEGTESEEVQKIYGELVTKTLELWLELGDGNASFEDVVKAFEHAQSAVESDVQPETN